MNPDEFDHPFHSALPIDAQVELMRAQKTPITLADPLARVKAIDQATQRIKQRYPQFFR